MLVARYIVDSDLYMLILTESVFTYYTYKKLQMALLLGIDYKNIDICRL